MMKRPQILVMAALVTGIPAAFGQTQAFYGGTNVTGLFTLYRTVNASVQAQTLQGFGLASTLPETVPPVTRPLHPPVQTSFFIQSTPFIKGLNVVTASAGFNGLAHLDQRLANNGNQFSVEPPNPSIAAANGYILEGVNNAIQVYDVSGRPLLARVLSSNELFGVPAAINRTTGANGVFPTDMRVFYDQGINRWFVLQRSQDNDIFGDNLNSSHIYMAVSQTPDPTGTYNIYVADTTNASIPGCPCLPDYPQIGADQYGFYVSVNQFNTFSQTFVNAMILAVSKASLATGATAPTTHRFIIPFTTGYEFAIQPATTPPGASYFLGNGGLEYFASTVGSFSAGNNAAIWAMWNTSSLGTGQPNLTLARIIVPTFPYFFPDSANQPAGFRPYGSSLFPPGLTPLIDGGDIRALSLSYSGGRLFLTLSTSASDEAGQSVVGGLYVVFSPSVRSTTLMAPVVKQNYMVVKGNHLLRPSIAVNAQGRGAIAVTLVGPNWYPSAAFIPFDMSLNPTTIQVAGVGALPEDGFTGYTNSFGAGLARWGDYSAAVVSTDGSIWMAAEYIANLPRTQLANWDTFVMQNRP